MNKRIPTEQEIAKKHNIPINYIIRQAEIGSTVEREHVTTHEEAYGIALQHIMEFPNYYSHLLSMEKKLKKEWKKNKSHNKTFTHNNMKINHIKKINEDFDKFYNEYYKYIELLEKKNSIFNNDINITSETNYSISDKKLYTLSNFQKNENKENSNEVPLLEKNLYKNYSKFLIDSNNSIISVLENSAWTKKEGKNKNGGLNEKGRKSYERENPGSDLKPPSKKVGNPRRDSFCARMKGLKKKLTSKKTANDPNSRVNKSLRAWNC